MIKDTPQQLSEIINNPAAHKFALDICSVLRFWDAVSVGQASSVAEVNQSMWTAVVDIPQNEFYRTHFDVLHPLVTSAILDWMTAVQIEMKAKASMAEIEHAYACRQSYISLLVMVAACAGGPAYASRAGPLIRAALDDGGLKKYITELKKRPLPQAPGEGK